MNGLTCNKGAIAGRLRCVRHGRWLAAFLLASHSLCYAAAQAGAQSPSVHELFEQGQTLARDGRIAESEMVGVFTVAVTIRNAVTGEKNPVVGFN